MTLFFVQKIKDDATVTTDPPEPLTDEYFFLYFSFICCCTPPLRPQTIAKVIYYVKIARLGDIQLFL